MADLVVPALGESITEAVVSSWLKQVGDAVAADEPVAELETDKITVQLPSPVAGVLAEQKVAVGATVRVGDVIGAVDAAAARAQPPVQAARSTAPASAVAIPVTAQAPAAVSPQVAASAAPAVVSVSASPVPASKPSNGDGLDKSALLRLTPSQRATAREAGSMPQRASAPAGGAAPGAAPSGPSIDDRLAHVDPRD